MPASVLTRPRRRCPFVQVNIPSICSSAQTLRRRCPFVQTPLAHAFAHLLSKYLSPYLLHNQQLRCRIPKIQFRVLILGWANAGKTSILHRICDTTKSKSIVYRGNGEVRSPTILSASLVSLPTKDTLDNPTMDVSDDSPSLWLHLNMRPARRAQDRR
jgi:hypothetical protein